jgi:hypothetical protein
MSSSSVCSGGKVAGAWRWPPPDSVEVKNEWICTSTSECLHGMQWDDFTSTFLSAITWCGTLMCEGKGHPITHLEGTQGEWRCSSTYSQPWCQMGVGSQCHIPAASPQERTSIAILEAANMEHNWCLNTSQTTTSIIQVVFHLYQQSKHRVSLLSLCIKFSLMTQFFIPSGFLGKVRIEVAK